MTRRKAGDLPEDARAALAGTLFASPWSLVVGAVGVTLISFLVAARAQDAGMLAAAWGVASLGTVRIAILGARFAWPRLMGARAWRAVYAVGSIAGALALAVVAVLCLGFQDDPVSHMMLVASFVGYTSGITGRNAACLEASLPQLWIVTLPICACLALHGGADYVALAACSGAFALGMNGIALSIHSALVDAYAQAQEREATAARFDAALSSMHHGLALFDVAGRLEAASQSLGVLLGIPRPAIGSPVGDLTAACAAAGLRAGDGGDPVGVLGGPGTSFVNREVVLADGRTLQVAVSPRECGGWVVVADDVTERARASERLARDASRDPVTGLLNRSAHGVALEEALAAGAPVSVHLIDLDRFKAVNDSHGHAVGDALLRAVAGRIGDLLPPGATAARLGGDEFAVVQPGDAAGRGALAAAIVAAVEMPFQVEGREVSVSASVGVASSPDDGTSPATLTRCADTALYRVKAEGRCGWRPYDPGMDARERERREMEADLREALALGQIQVVYQPQRDLATGRVTAFEALSRWTHPVRGVVPPSDFIPLAEETGLIHRIGLVVLDRACRDAAAWPDGIRVAVNVSPAQFRHDLASAVAATLSETGLPGHRLELEVTESVFLGSREEVQSAFLRLGAMGVRVALDDFGTGYSSLGYLRSFPFGKVKIDRSFVAGLEAGGESRAIIRAVSGLGRDLGMQVVVEGVETNGQLEALSGLGCTAIQGYLVGRPLGPSEAGALVSCGTKAPIAAAA